MNKDYEWVSKCLRGIARALVAVILLPFYWPKATGNLKGPKEEGCILIANHHSLLDPILMTYFFKSTRLNFVAKAELFRIPVIGRFLRAFHSIPLDRNAADIKASKTILSEIKAGKMVGIFLQGTRVKLHEASKEQPHASILYYAIRRRIPVIHVSIDPRYHLFGRPRFLFGDPIRYLVNDKVALDKTEQDKVAREVMRLIYERVELPYEYDGWEENRLFYNQRIKTVPISERESL
ncbi:MAG: lysophospholipid acyltransferase family protein [Eubacteriales bacterium]|nr:lysophospholipid acyltransferase family protein [Eubacteriales bacterium]